jgi:SWI/SNF-related matrix-associated actin-dependent regulator of chromatin subfamily A3
MGQTKPVEAIKLMMNDSIEVKMSERQKKKNTLAKLTLKGMSKAELLERRVSLNLIEWNRS